MERFAWKDSIGTLLARPNFSREDSSFRLFSVPGSYMKVILMSSETATQTMQYDTFSDALFSVRTVFLFCQASYDRD